MCRKKRKTQVSDDVEVRCVDDVEAHRLQSCIFNEYKHHDRVTQSLVLLVTQFSLHMKASINPIAVQVICIYITVP